MHERAIQLHIPENIFDLQRRDDSLERKIDGVEARLTRRIDNIDKKYLSYFFAYLAKKGIDRPESEHINAYREALAASGKKDSTLFNYLAAVRLFFPRIPILTPQV